MSFHFLAFRLTTWQQHKVSFSVNCFHPIHSLHKQTYSLSLNHVSYHFILSSTVQYSFHPCSVPVRSASIIKQTERDSFNNVKLNVSYHLHDNYEYQLTCRRLRVPNSFAMTTHRPIRLLPVDIHTHMRALTRFLCRQNKTCCSLPVIVSHQLRYGIQSIYSELREFSRLLRKKKTYIRKNVEITGVEQPRFQFVRAMELGVGAENAGHVSVDGSPSFQKSSQ